MGCIQTSEGSKFNLDALRKVTLMKLEVTRRYKKKLPLGAEKGKYPWLSHWTTLQTKV